jgi:hypothetical protein
MKNFTLIISLLISVGLYAQTADLSPYQKKTMKTERFARPVNTGINHTLLILGSAWETTPEIGDEIAVYDSERNLVSSVAWRPEQEGHSGMAIWGDDELTKEKEGMLSGETFSIVLFDKSEDMITELKVNQWDRGDNMFTKDGLSVISSITSSNLVIQELELFQNVPNPVIDNTSISFYLPNDGNVILTISNTLGQEIMTLASDNFTKGMHTIQMDANAMSTGVYFFNLEADNNSITKQLTIIK